MPFAALKPCSRCGRNLTSTRFCAECSQQPATHQDSRLSSSQRGYDARWRRYRARYLKEHPLCADIHGYHQGRPVPASVVDHITPHKGNMVLFWDESNWQSLCKHCHDVKTATEDGGWGRERTKKAQG